MHFTSHKENELHAWFKMAYIYRAAARILTTATKEITNNHKIKKENNNNNKYINSIFVNI